METNAVLILTGRRAFAQELVDTLSDVFTCRINVPTGLTPSDLDVSLVLIDLDDRDQDWDTVMAQTCHESRGACVLLAPYHPDPVEGARFTRMGAQDILDVSQMNGQELASRLTMAAERARILTISQEATLHIRSVIELVSDAILIIDDQITVVFANSASEELFGKSIEELFGAPSPVDVSDGNQEYRLLEFLRPDGHMVHASLHTSRILWEGRHAHMLAMRDLTTETELRQHLLDAQITSEKTKELKASFLANMSHELRMPLASIVGFAEIIEETSENAEMKEFAALIQESGGRLLHAINSVLDMSRLEAGRFEAMPEDVDIAEIIDGALRLMKPLSREKDIELVADGPSPLFFNTDPVFLERVMNNLVGNAIKFTDTGFVRAEWKLHDAMLDIRVSDTGIGISPDFIPRIFEEFSQESTGRARQYTGTGLGLAITQRLITELGGRISVSSEKGAGTTFSVQIPQSRPAEDDTTES